MSGLAPVRPITYAHTNCYLNCYLELVNYCVCTVNCRHLRIGQVRNHHLLGFFDVPAAEAVYLVRPILVQYRLRRENCSRNGKARQSVYNNYGWCMCVAGTASSHVLLGHNLKKPLMFSYCDLSLCIYHMWSDVFRVQDTGYNNSYNNSTSKVLVNNKIGQYF